jgi:hypothetical protein
MDTMKRSLLILFTIAASVFANTANAQCYDENTHLINLGIGFGNSYYKFSRVRGYEFGRTPIFNLSYEQPLKNKVGPGYIGVGAYLSFQHAHQRYTYPDYVYNGIHYQNEAYYQHNWNYYVIAARGAYHWDGLNADKAEVYAGTIIGVRINSYNYTYHNIDPNDKNELSEGAVYPALAVYAGARWYFVPNVALFGEVASGVSFLTGGLTFKF